MVPSWLTLQLAQYNCMVVWPETITWVILINTSIRAIVWLTCTLIFQYFKWVASGIYILTLSLISHASPSISISHSIKFWLIKQKGTSILKSVLRREYRSLVIYILPWSGTSNLLIRQKQHTSQWPKGASHY